MFTLTTRRPTNRRTRLQLELCEDRAVPTVFTFSNQVSPVEGLTLQAPTGPAATFAPLSAYTNQWFTLINTDADPDYEKVSITFVDSDPDQETAYLLVYQKTDNSTGPPVDPSAQLLFASAGVTTTGTVGQSYTLTADLPACGFQIDAAVIGGANQPLSPVTPLPTGGFMPRGYQTALDHPWAGAVGANDCPGGGIEGGPDAGPTRTQGYWKNHPEAWTNVSLTLGNVLYSQADLLKILKTPVQGNGAISMAHQLIAAKLNFMIVSNVSDATLAAIDNADQLLINAAAAQPGKTLLNGLYIDPATTSSTTSTLDGFNNSGDNLPIP